MQSFIDAQLAASRASTLANSPQLTLGELISQLEAIPIREGDNEQGVYFDFEYFIPTVLSSWRGSYSELAIEFGSNSPVKFSSFLAMLKEAVGKTFEGYKGGDFIMNRHTPVWVANYGNSGNTGVVGVKDCGYKIVILTAYCEF